jgi:two-component system response regulator FixJ
MSISQSVYIIDDDKAVRDSLAWLLESVGWQVRSYASASAFLDELQGASGPPHGCLIVDIRLPGMSGLDLQDTLVRQEVDTPVIIVTGHADVPLAVRAMKSGAFDFIEKPYSDQVLLDRVREAMERDRNTSARAARRELYRQRVKRLSAREKQTMDLVVQGKLNKEIAADLNLSPKTVEVHRANVMDKMEASSLAELVRMVVTIEDEAPA